MFTIILLAAGHSRRFGSPKPLADFHGQALIDVMLTRLEEIQDVDIVVVLGANDHRIRPCLLKHKGCKTVYNKDYNLGQTSSVQAGVRALSPEARGFFLLPVDCPFVAVPTFALLAVRALKEAEKDFILVPAFQGRKGHPPLFSMSFAGRILDLPVDQGVNELVRQYAHQVKVVETPDEAVVESFNTVVENERLKGKYPPPSSRIRTQ